MAFQGNDKMMHQIELTLTKDEEDSPNDFLHYAYITQIKFSHFVIGITPSKETFFNIDYKKNNSYSAEVKKELQKDNAKVESFAYIKYFLEKWFFDITEKGELEFNYREGYLLRSSNLQAQLDVSRATIQRCVENGMEKVEGVGHACYPMHNVVYWNDGLWASRIQALQQQFKIRNRDELELQSEIEKQISEFESRYEGSFSKVFADVISGDLDVYDLDEPDDYKDWRDLEKDLEIIREKKQSYE